MNFIRLFDNTIHNLHHIKKIGLYKNYIGKEYALIRWKDQDLSGNFAFFHSSENDEKIYKDEHPEAYDQLKQLIDNTSKTLVNKIE